MRKLTAIQKSFLRSAFQDNCIPYARPTMISFDDLSKETKENIQKVNLFETLEIEANRFLSDLWAEEMNKRGW